VISTAITSNRGFAMGSSSDAASCRVRTAAPVATPAIHDAHMMSQQISQHRSADYRLTAEPGAFAFKGQVWFRPATLDVLVPTTPGHLAWSPPT
jgi:hypothetical protein